MKSKAECVLGREDIFEQVRKQTTDVPVLWFSVQNYDVTFQMRSLVNGAEAEVPMLILGPPGSGKSSIMAKIVDETCMRASKREIPG